MPHNLITEQQPKNTFQEKVYQFILNRPNCTAEDIAADPSFKFQEVAVYKACTFLMLNGWTIRDDRNSSLQVRA